MKNVIENTQKSWADSLVSSLVSIVVLIIIKFIKWVIGKSHKHNVLEIIMKFNQKQRLIKPSYVRIIMKELSCILRIRGFYK